MRKYRLRPHAQAYKRDLALRNAYGISLEEYDNMLESQLGCCAICAMTPEKNGRRLDVDHCHETGRVRGLLCASCNLGIGKFKDNPSLLAEAIKYLVN
jgi:hypothetical protein